MRLKPYQRLAPFYHKEWTGFVENYISIIKNLELKSIDPPVSVLDIACGTGVLVGELSKIGFSVKGTDISKEMIEVSKTEFPNIDFIVSDMRVMNLKIKVDLITCTFDSLNYLTSIYDINRVFNNVYRHLNDSGYFLFDINTPKLYEDKQHGTIHRVINGYKFDQILYYDKEEMISRTVFKFNDGYYEEHIQRPYTYNEILKLISGNRMKLMNAFKNKELQPYESTSYKIYFLAQKIDR